MNLKIKNIPKDKFINVQAEILSVLINNGLKDVETISIEDGLSCEFIGYEFEIKIDKSKRPAVTSSSVCG